MPILPCRVLTVSINRPPAVVYAFAGNPANLPQWAAGLGGQIINQDGRWIVQTPQGQAILQFVPDNAYGIMDHTVTLPDGQVVHVPMRVIPNGSGSLVTFTLFQQPGMTEDQYEQDAAIVENDLKTLKALLEAQAAADAKAD
jgi:uncharacterized protein YndB with AHSA1/START domain